MLAKKEIQQVLSKSGIRPLKRLGQNFLIDGNIKDKIIEALAPSKDNLVIEIGPGLGALTFDLLDKVGHLVAVEKDRSLHRILGEMALEARKNPELILADIRDVDIRRLAGPKKVKIVGNLPYSVTTPLLEYLIANRASIEYAVITIQKEVAARILAKAGSKEYGAISCFVQYYTRVVYLYTIKRTCFYPQPEVDSSLIRLDMLEAPAVDVRDEKLFFTITRKAFNQRRKTILNSLTSKALGTVASREGLLKALERSGIDPSSRPEDLNLQAFASLANNL